MKKNYIDLTKLSDMSEEEMRNAITGPGRYKIPVVSYREDNKYASVIKDGVYTPIMDIVYVSPAESRMVVIVVDLGGGVYQDMYYNDYEEVFKILTIYEGEEVDEEIAEEYPDLKPNSFGLCWALEGVGVPCPPEFVDYTVADDVAVDNEFYACVYGDLTDRVL